MGGYLIEFVFRFNSRSSRSPGLLFCRLLKLAAGHDPVHYRQMTARGRQRQVRPAPGDTRRAWSAILLDARGAALIWR